MRIEDRNRESPVEATVRPDDTSWWTLLQVSPTSSEDAGRTRMSLAHPARVVNVLATLCAVG